MNSLVSAELAAVVIWYHPQNTEQETAVQNILTYSRFCKKIYIVDNSPNDNSGPASQVSNSRYIPNFDNLGIAKAQNQGCQAAVDDGYTWVMTMDQDSSWDNCEFPLYLSEVDNIISNDPAAVSFSPKDIDQKAVGSRLGDIKRRLVKKKLSVEQHDYEYPDRVIASGNIINLNQWKAVGKFNEELFINDVDYDFCYRLIQNGYKIIKINKCKMNHINGEQKKYFFPHAFSYHKERIYYMTRNKVFIIKKYPEFANKYNYKKTVRRLFLEKLFFFEFSDLIYAIKGFIDGKKDHYGKYTA
jgi:rhamnosyltransferase